MTTETTVQAPEQKETERPKAQTLQGLVLSNKMDKTVVVEVTHRMRHKVYLKYVTRKVRYMAHDEGNQYQQGDVVRIASCRPMSRHKRWRVQTLVERPA